MDIKIKASDYNDLLKLGIDEVLHLAKIGQQTQWLSVKPDTMPDDGQFVDLYFKADEGDYRLTNVQYIAPRKSFIDLDRNMFSAFDESGKIKLYWMPVPEPPKEDKPNEA